VMLNEIAHARTDAQWILYDNLVNAAYESTSLGRSPLPADQSVIHQLNRSAVEAHLDQVEPAGLAVVAVGNVNHDEVVKAAEKAFGSLAAPHKHHHHWEVARFLGGDVFHWNMALKTCHLAFGMESAAATHDDALFLMILPELFGSWTWDQGTYTANTTIAKEMAWMHWIKNFKAHYIPFTDTGLFGFYFQSDPSLFKDWLQKTPTIDLFLELTRLQFQMLDLEFDNAKARLIANLATQSTQTPIAYLEEIGKHVLLHGRHVGLPEIATRLQSLTVHRAQQIYHEYFYDQTVLISGLGDLRDSMDGMHASFYTSKFRV